MPKVNIEVSGNFYECNIYMWMPHNVVRAVILYVSLSEDHGDILLGAYYGAVGGGVSDGGFFRVDIELSTAENLDYGDVDEQDQTQAAILNALMQRLWTLVDDDNGEGDLLITTAGEKLFTPDKDGIWMSKMFDGYLLGQMSHRWRIPLIFKG